MRRCFLSSLCLLWMLLPSTSLADWTQARGDASRRASSPLLMDFFSPTETWRFFLGGSLASHQLLPGPADSKGEPTVLMVAAGRVEARRSDDALIWSSTGAQVYRLLGRFDLDGDSKDELVALGFLPSGDPAALVFDANQGELLWHSPPGDVGVLRDTARVVDLDGDLLPDIYLADAGSNLPGSIPYGVHAYGFADGVKAGKPLWAMKSSPGRDYFASLNDAIGDFTGDGLPDIFAQGLKRVYLYSGQTGELIGASEPVGNMAAARSEVIVKDLNGDGKAEAITCAKGGWASSINAVRVAVFGFDERTKKPVLLWERSAKDPDAHPIACDRTGLADVDGIPGLEIVFSLAEPEWTTEVRDAWTGALKQSLPGRRFNATVDIDQDGTHEVLTHERGTPIEVFDVSGTQPELVTTLGDRLMFRCAERSSEVSGVLVTKPCRVGPHKALVLSPYDDEFQATHFQIVDASTQPPQMVGDYPLFSGLRFLNAWLLESASGASRLAGAISSGRLVFFDAKATPLNYSPHAEQPVLGVRIRNFDPGYGGLKRAPIAVDLNDKPGEELLFLTSDSRAIALNMSTATTAGNALPIWDAERAQSVVAGRGEMGLPRVIIAGKETLTGLSAQGEVLWSRTLFSPVDQQVRQYGDVVTLDLDGDGRDEVVTQSRDYKNGEHRLMALDIDTGEDHFDVLIDTNNSGMRRLTGMLRGDGTGKDLIGGQPSALWRFDGLTGSPEVLSSTDLGVYAIAFDLDGTGDEELLAVNREGLACYDSQGEELWRIQTPLIKPVLGSAVFCEGQARYVSPYANGTEIWHRDLLTGEVLWSRTLADGEGFDTPEDAVAAGALPSLLGNLAAARLGSGEPVLLVGTQSGWLYGVHGCSGTVLWSLDLGRPLREVIIADWDGDGEGEVVATAVDGTVSGVDREQMAQVAYVRDTDPPRGIVDTDVDDIESFDTLYASWAPVEDATEYKVAVFTVDGTGVTDGFIDVGNVTEVTLEGLSLGLSVRYVVAVVAEGPSGRSSARLSDGVTVVDISPPEATLSLGSDTVSIGDAVNINYTATDKTGLASVRVQLLTKAFVPVKELALHESPTSPEIKHTITFEPLSDSGEALEAKAYWVRLVARDVGNHETVVDVSLEVVSGPSISQPEADPPPAGAEIEPEAEVISGESAGCTCSQGRPPSPWLVIFVLMVLWEYRRRGQVALINKGELSQQGSL